MEGVAGRPAFLGRAIGQRRLGGRQSQGRRHTGARLCVVAICALASSTAVAAQAANAEAIKHPAEVHRAHPIGPDRLGAKVRHRGSGEQAHASVINGEIAAQGTFPYMAFIEFNNGSERGLCSGTVMSSNVILTAAHCVMNSTFSVLRNPANLAVATGTVDWTSAQRTVSAVSRVAINPNLAWLVPSYTVVRGDAAVLQLSAPISAPSVRLATTQTWAAGTPVALVGWGRTEPNSEPPTTLHVGESVVQGAGYCASHFSYFDSSATLCAVDYPRSQYAVCSGDSGGPLLMIAPGTTNEPLEVGITSFGNTGCPTSSPQYFTRSDYVSSWVGQKVAEWAPPAPSPPPPTTKPAPLAPPAEPTPITLPRMSKAAALSFVRGGLLEGLRYRFNRRSGFSADCRSIRRAAQKCSVSWRALGYEYSGTITVFYAFKGDKLVWNHRYRIRQKLGSCHRHCAVVTFKR